MPTFSGDWTALASGTPVTPYLRGELFDGEVWTVEDNPHTDGVARISREGIRARDVRRDDGWELSRQ